VSGTLTYSPPARERADSPGEQLERLYGASRDDLYAYLATLLGDHSAAEEVTALAFERAFRKSRLFNPRRGSERAWLFGIARNAALDELRRRRRTAPLPEGVAAEGITGDDHSERSARRAALQVALAGLAPRERELIALKFHAGLSNPDLARVLGVSESNAGTLLHRAITKLRKACDEQA